MYLSLGVVLKKTPKKINLISCIKESLMEAVMKKPLLTIVGTLMLLQTPFAMGEETVTISLKDLNALKSLCSSLKSATATAPTATKKPVMVSNNKADTPDIGKAVKIASLRGFHALDKEAKEVEKKKQFKSGDGIKRNWELQPPSIPHNIEKDRITLKGNTCLKCHSEANHEKEKAPAISKSHYVSRDMKVVDKLPSRRYFCNQCHTPQADVDPLVKNSFESNSIKLDNLLMDKVGK